MKNQLCYTFLLLFFIQIGTNAQHNVPEPLMEKIDKIFELGQKGYKKLDAKPLLKAAEILIKNPEIQQFSDSTIIDSAALNDDEYINYQAFFNPELLLADAKRMAPVDANRLKRKIARLEKKLPNYREMSAQYKEKGGDIKVKNYVIYSKNSKTISTSFEGNQKIILSVRVGNDLRLSVFDKKTKKKVGKSQVIDDARMISFTAKQKVEYQIKIENVASQPNDCLLIIETK